MKEARRAALIVELVGSLRDKGSWAGETHVQKTLYFLQELLEVPLGLRFSLYKYGPFSFELRDQLAQMRGLDQLELEPQPHPYGPKLKQGPGAAQLRTRFPKTLGRYEKAVSFVADELGSKGVGSLERLATALMVTRELGAVDLDDRAALLHQYKPHVSVDDAREALLEVDKLAEKASLSASDSPGT